MHVSLRPVVLDDIDLFESAFGSLEGASEFQWFGYTNLNGLRDAVAERGALGGSANTLSVLGDDVVIGRVDWFARSWGRPNTSTCWELAIGLLPEFRGRGLGLCALRLLVDYVFTHTPVERLQVTTDPENAPVRAIMDRLGFALEGHARSSQWRGGRWHDQLLYSLLRQEWEGEHDQARMISLP